MQYFPVAYKMRNLKEKKTEPKFPFHFTNINKKINLLVFFQLKLNQYVFLSHPKEN